jgi:hypothetical protein
MRPVPHWWADSIATSHHIVARVDAYLGARRIAEGIPLVSGTITYDRTAKLRRRVVIVVPLVDIEGNNWEPVSPGDPLACFGQQLHISAGIVSDAGVALCDQGRYLITEWATDRASGTLTVTAMDTMQLVLDSAFAFDNIAPFDRAGRPGPGGTYRGLIAYYLDKTMYIAGSGMPEQPPVHPYVIDPGVNVDQAVTNSHVAARDRYDSLVELCDQLGARPIVQDDGVLHITPWLGPLGPPVATLHDGPVGTVAERDRSGSRARLFNWVKARGRNPVETSPLNSDPWYATWLNAPHPLAIDGPFGAVPYFVDSDALPTLDRCQAVAGELLDVGAMLAHNETVTCIPDPAIQLEDVVRFHTRQGEFTGLVTAITLPLVAGDLMTVSVSNDVRGGTRSGDVGSSSNVTAEPVPADA